MPDSIGDLHRAIPPAIWLTSRARNAMRRPVFIGAVSVGTFVAALVALVLAPQQTRRTAQISALQLGSRPDTAGLAVAIGQAQVRLVAAESGLADARRRLAAAPSPTVGTVNPAVASRRDTLARAINDLNSLLARVETAPLSASYRSLAESPVLTSNARVRVLLDSLGEIDRDREGFGASGGADPVFVALTSRATEIGRAIQTIAEDRRESMRRDMIKLSAASDQRAALESAPSVDTASWIAELDSARARVALTNSALSDARAVVREYNQQVARAHQLANMAAPPLALLASALIFGMALGFGAALADELKNPRVSDAHEVERVTGARVLATVSPASPVSDHSRRADQPAPSYFDPGAGSYQLAYLHVVRTGASRLMLTIAGEDVAVAAVVATNLAAIAADEARTTIIVDTETRTSPIAAALRIHAEPGIVDILDGRVEWAEAIAHANVGPDRVIDVIPSGVSAAERNPAEVAELFRREVARLARYYEAIIIVATPQQATGALPAVLPIPDTILCARVGHSRLATLQKTLTGVSAAGGNPLGIVLWDGELPAFPTPEQLARAPHPVRTTEMRALTTTT